MGVGEAPGPRDTSRPRRGAGPGEIRPGRCPACGQGDLFSALVARSGGDAYRAVYCAGSYDRDRRKYVARGCGYSGRGDLETQEGAGVPGGPQAARRGAVQPVEAAARVGDQPGHAPDEIAHAIERGAAEVALP